MGVFVSAPEHSVYCASVQRSCLASSPVGEEPVWFDQTDNALTLEGDGMEAAVHYQTQLYNSISC